MKTIILEKIAKLAEKRTLLMIVIALVLTIIAGGLSESLELKMNFKDLMPQSHPTVIEYDSIIENYSAASNIIIAATGAESELKQFADEIAPKVEAMDQYIKRVNYKVNRKFIEEHAFILTKTKDLKSSKDMYKNLGIIPYITELNNSFEETYVADGEESISNKEKENNAVASLEGIENWLIAIKEYVEKGDELNPETAEKAVDKLLLGEEYMLSQDKNMIVLFAQPSFPTDEMDKSMILIHNLDSLIKVTKAKYPSIEMAGTAGTMSLAVAETDAASSDMMTTSFISFILIIALFIISFRMWSAPLLAGISLIIGVVWTAGFTAITLGSLNMMTSMFAVILIGLGIDFNIHVISAYNENRAAGHDISDAMKLAFLKAGNGIVIGAITTALAFLTMLISENAGMKEFGLVAGVGVLLTMFASLLVLPSMLVLHDRIRNRKIEKVKLSLSKIDPESETYNKKKNKIESRIAKLNKTRTTNFDFMGRMASAIYHKPVLFLSISIFITVLLLYSALKISFNYDYLSLEPKGLQCVAIQDTMLEKYDISPDMVMVTTSSVEESRRIAEEAKKLKKTGMVTSISNFIPSGEEYNDRLPYLKGIKSDLENNKEVDLISAGNLDQLIDELYRIEDNIIELAQLSFTGGQDKVDKKAKSIVGDLEVSMKERKSLVTEVVKAIQADEERSIKNVNKFISHYEPHLRQMALNMTSDDIITVENLPQDIRQQFASSDNSHFLVSVYPKEQAWNFEFLELFSKQMHKIDDRVTGMPLVFYILITYIGKDGAMAAGLTLIVVFFLLLADFRSAKLAALTMIPLLFGTIWMLGFMQLVGMQLNVLNVMGVPLILGIGIDDGVHILHRYKIEGKGKIRTIFSSTGKAVLLTSITTFLAFGSLGFSLMRGLASLGVTLAIGITTCLLTTVIILPAIIGLMDKKTNNNI